MPRFVFWVPVLCLAVAAAQAQKTPSNEPCSVQYLGKKLELDPPAVRLGDECFVPVRHMKLFGWDAKTLDAAALISSGDGSASVFLREVDGVRCFPLRVAAQLLGGLTYWLDEGRRLGVFARIEWIGAAEGRLSVKTSLPVTPEVFALDGPDRVVIDLPSTVYLPSAPPVTKGLELGVRVGRPQEHKLRIVCDLAAAPKLEPARVVNSRQYELAWAGAKYEPHLPPGLDALKKEYADIEKGPVILGKPTVEGRDENTYVVTFPTDRLLRGKTSIKRSSGALEIEIPNAVALEDAKFEEEKGFLSSLTTAAKKTGPVASLVLKFAVNGAVGVNVAPGAKQFAITINKPKTATGKLAEKTIVIDPGHGGADTGATWGTGDAKVNEKDFNLAIGKKVAKLLSEAGAAVIMTRSDDSFPSLSERAGTANQSEADFFISIHHNSNGKANSRSGTFTYYHDDDEDSSLLAQCVQDEIAKVTGLPDHGTLEDTTRFPSRGMAVLRETKMPAVLLEVAYINHDTDRGKMKDEKFQQQVAEAIAKGIRAYIGDLKDGKAKQ